MTPDDRAFGASVEAFRRATARDADGEATRARVLVAAGGRARRRLAWRHTAVSVAIGVFAVLSASAAWTALGHWRAPPARVTPPAVPIADTRAPRAVVAPPIAVAMSSEVSTAPQPTCGNLPQAPRVYALQHGRGTATTMRSVCAPSLVVAGNVFFGHLQIQSDVACPTADDVSASLHRLLGAELSAAAALSVSRGPAALEVRLTDRDGATLNERALPDTGDCAADAQAIAVLTAAWAAELPPVRQALLAPPPTRPPGDTPATAPSRFTLRLGTGVASPISTRAGLVRHDDGEARAYGQAHAAHFVADAPAEALGLWDAYLRRYPRGTFVPEAQFNRALCLLRLGRRDEARAALRPFAAGELGGYRQREASTLIDWTEPAP